MRVKEILLIHEFAKKLQEYTTAGGLPHTSRRETGKCGNWQEKSQG
jgi:hypothetical protein